MISKAECDEEPRVVVVGRVGGAHEIKIIGPKALADRIGSDLFAAFLKCFVGCDRISTFEQMLMFNGKYLPENSVAYKRNLKVTREAHINFSDRLMEVFLEVVKTANVEVFDERTK